MVLFIFDLYFTILTHCVMLVDILFLRLNGISVEILQWNITYSLDVTFVAHLVNKLIYLHCLTERTI